MDIFTLKRLQRRVRDFREEKGQLPTLQDLEAEGFDKGLVAQAVKKKLIEELYVTLTNGVIMKGYKAKA